MAPTILSRRHDGDGVVIFQGRNRVFLTASELNNLRVAIERPPAVSPAKARLICHTAPTA
ncbi:MAG: hypothetical protein JWR34_1797 [Mycobacterium sp.]|nr:hypothetical protein [Mycobacterium sp.]